MDQIQIYVIQLKAFEASVKSTFDISDTLRVIPDFGGDKKFLPGDGSLFERTAHTVFIFVGGSGIEQPVSDVKSGCDRIFHLVFSCCFVDAKPEKRHFDSAVQVQA